MPQDMPETLSSVNPATGKEIATYTIHSHEAIEKMLHKARQTQELWKQKTLKERAATLLLIAQQIRKDKEKLALLATLEMGKPIQQGRDELEKCARTLEYYAQEGPTHLANVPVKTDARKSYITYQPMGVVLAVMPWNFPYWQVFRCLAPILMGGNTVVLKHASNVSGCAMAIEKTVQKSGAMKGLIHTMLIPSGRVEEIIAHPAISAVTFTGSTAVGSKIAATAGKYLKKQVLELGGSDAYVVLEDANIKKAVDICVKARLVNTGQSCLAAKRFIVHKAIRKEFEAQFTAAMQQATYGDPMDTNNMIGPMARPDLRQELHEQVLRSVAMGAKLLCGGYIPEGDGAYYPPTVLTQVKKGMPAYDEELFGPVAAIIEAKNEADALHIANDSIYGLGGCILTRNRARGEQLAAEQLQAGNCFVNAQVHSDARMPFGGIKQSGYGRELGIFGIHEFVNIKSVFIQ